MTALAACALALAALIIAALVVTVVGPGLAEAWKHRGRR